MSSGFPERLAAIALVLSLLQAVPSVARELKVCADPNNLPFSNQKEEGFENKIVAIVADELGTSVSYTWWAQRRGFIRQTLRAGRCDLVPGTAVGVEMLHTTQPYYRSGYVFVTRKGETPVASLDDPALRRMRIGVQLIGDDGVNSPPVHALARRGIVGNLKGFPVYGNYAEAAPGRRIVDAVASGEVDAAVVWGPTAGYFATQEPVALTLSPVTPQIDLPMLPMAFDIAMGVRRDDKALREEVNAALKAREAEIDAVLRDYGVPRLDQVEEQ